MIEHFRDNVDVPMRIQNLIFETNVGYKNTKINLEARIHKIRTTTLREFPTDSTQRLTDFFNRYGNSMLQGKHSFNSHN